MKGVFGRIVAGIAIIWCLAVLAEAPRNLVLNPDLKKSAGSIADYQLTGGVEYRFLGDPRKDSSTFGVALQSSKSSGSVSQIVRHIDPAQGRWMQFSFRGLPQDDFAVSADDGLYMKAEFFGKNGAVAYDGKAEELYPLVQQARHDFTVNGVHHENGAEVWRTYSLDFYLPFPQVDSIRLTVGFNYGSARRSDDSDFFVSDFSLTHIDPPEADTRSTTQPTAIDVSHEKLIPLGGRWYYRADAGHPQPPSEFNYTNADRLLYHDAVYSAPFVGNMTSVLKAGDKNLNGQVIQVDTPVLDNVTVRFTSDAMVMHSHNLPNHPTGKYPSYEIGGNPNRITEQNETFYIPLDPKVNPRHFSTTANNSNHALPMGPIGIALNGVVFFNPFDMGNQDATDLMDRCCGHPQQQGVYHYHKYPICVNSPWDDQGTGHSALIGFAFDGFPLYGPYESKDEMAKDLTGENALNDFNIHFDPQRGWHYHVTPGKFPYLIGGYWGTEDTHDVHRGPPGGGGPAGGQNGMRGSAPGRGPRPSGTPVPSLAGEG